MIGIFKRAFRGTDEEEPSWDVEEELPEPKPVETHRDQVGELPSTGRRGVFVPYDTDVVQRQVELIRAALAQGGRFGDHEIPVPWLRMMLAGLEGRPTDQDAIWEGIASPPRKEPVEESPTYQELFPTIG